MFCHHCGSQVAAGAQFCPSCGQSVSVAGALGPSAPMSWTPPSGVQSQTGRWLGAGWRVVTDDLVNYVLLTIVFLILSAAVPIILQGPLIAGLHIYTMKRLTGRPAEFADLFKGFNFFVPTLVASLLIALFSALGTALCIIPGLVIAAMYKFTYLFIVDKRMDFWPAMQASHAIVKQDYFGFTLFLLAAIAVNILGVLCFAVGLLVTIPMTFAAITVAYQEIRRIRRLDYRGVVAAAALFTIFFLVTPPPDWRVCLFHWLTGLDCPLCGLTRGLFALAKGHLAEAIRWNLLTPLAAVMLLALSWRGKWVARLWTGGAAAFLLYGACRVLV